MGPRQGPVESQVGCPKPTVSATAASPPPPTPLWASRTRVRNQRRITSPVTGFCNVSGMGHLLGYARVSTTDQQPQLQVDALQHAGCYRVFTETASGARTDRPTLTQHAAATPSCSSVTAHHSVPCNHLLGLAGQGAGIGVESRMVRSPADCPPQSQSRRLKSRYRPPDRITISAVEATAPEGRPNPG
jgi:hypothetical protein